MVEEFFVSLCRQITLEDRAIDLGGKKGQQHQHVSTMNFCLMIPTSFLSLPLPLLPLPIVLTLCLMIPTILLTGGKNAEKILRRMDIGQEQ